ncbi:hypothetical protein DEO72_LG5g1891 [Vigna unguiculata]|uniref:Uncharacterized protein n=1 Tax=Vigna unguiculata TaxID=3917 RepID=A0A4D6LYI4_VIGUN|nr:hypothetical protein DEO72_LG5g1891 [Vigna unguiculata]
MEATDRTSERLWVLRDVCGKGGEIEQPDKDYVCGREKGYEGEEKAHGAMEEA